MGDFEDRLAAAYRYDVRTFLDTENAQSVPGSSTAKKGTVPVSSSEDVIPGYEIPDHNLPTEPKLEDEGQPMSHNRTDVSGSATQTTPANDRPAAVQATASQEALAQALLAVDDTDPNALGDIAHDDAAAPTLASAILDALEACDGFGVYTPDIIEDWLRQGAQQERERLRALFADFPPDYMLTAASVLKRLADPEDDR